MLEDRYGLALSTTSAAARDGYVQGCDRYLSMYPGAVAAFDEAISADPGFALPFAGKARVQQMRGDIPAAKASMTSKANRRRRWSELTAAVSKALQFA